MKVNIFNETEETFKEYDNILKAIFKKIKDKKNINVILTTDDRIKELNHKFRNIDKVTDVLSFINDEDPKSNGDVFISIPQMRRQALEYQHSELREIGFLAVHGYLHLKGYDHLTKKEEKEMIYLTENILSYVKLERKKDEKRN